MSKKLNQHFENRELNSEMLDKVCPADIHPQFRQRLSDVLSGESEKVVNSKEVKLAIKNWNNKLISLEKQTSAPLGHEVLAAANDDVYDQLKVA